MSSGSNSTDLLTEECYQVQAVTCELMAVVSNLPVTCYHLKKKKKKLMIQRYSTHLQLFIP